MKKMLLPDQKVLSGDTQTAHATEHSKTLVYSLFDLCTSMIYLVLNACCSSVTVYLRSLRV